MKRPSAHTIRSKLERRRLLEAEESRMADARDDARRAEATERFLESVYLGLDDLESARSEPKCGRHAAPR